jgi:hypothetical protein
MDSVLRYLMTRTWMSVACLLVAIPVAIRDVFALGYRFSCDVNFNIDAGVCSDPAVIFRQGANIDLACQVVAFSAFATLLALVPLDVDKKGRSVGVLLFLEAGALMVAIGLVLADSATYVARIPDTGYAEVSHVPGLVAVPAVALAFLLLRAFGAWNRIEPGDAVRRPRPLYRVS